jgi:PAS domain S-box-containing protein
MRAVVFRRAALIFLPIAVSALVLLNLLAPDAAMRADLALVWAAGLMLFALGAWTLATLWQGRVESEQAIRRNEARFRTLLNAAPDAVLIADTKGTILLANDETERMFGYRRDELVGSAIEMLVPARLRQKHVGVRTAYSAAPRPRAMGEGMTLSGQRKDGSEVPVAISLSPAVTDEGTLIFCDIRDISHQRRADEQIRQLNAQLGRDNAELASLNKELEAFSYSVSHDLRAPLRAIDGFSQALIEDYAERLDDTGRDYANRVRAAAQRMGHLIDDLLKLSRVARAEIAPEDVDLSALGAEIGVALSRSAPDRAVDFYVAPGMRAKGDARLLRIALENLLGNAWKFTGGREPACVAFGEAGADGAPTYYVRDNGAGFDMAYAGKLFGAFQRLHDVRQFPGTGIGLATVQRIVHKHGGRIWAESSEGNGATFFFRLGSDNAADDSRRGT